MKKVHQFANSWRIRIAFGLTSLAVLMGMLWMTFQILRFETMQREASERAALDESIRLALWRLDSALAPMVAQESVRPISVKSNSPYVKMSFELNGEGQISLFGYDESFKVDQGKLELATILPFDSVYEKLPEAPPEFTPSRNTFGQNPGNRSQQEFSQRQDNLMINNALVQRSPFAVNTIPLTPYGIGGEVFLVRRLPGDIPMLQGCWLDWLSIQTTMRELIRDLLPNATLEIYEDAPFEDGSNLLASLPARLIAGDLSPSSPPSLSHTRFLLIVTWLGVIGALVATAGFVYGSIRLAERRAAFVTAVTHELRTPLTTFLMYTEMLSQGMVEKHRQQSYVETLRQEALRLEHLVENVLAYAKLERKGKPSSIPVETIARLLERVGPYLQQRATMSQMELRMPEDGNSSSMVYAIPSVLEQILLNLVDNSCKYAAGSTPPIIELSIEELDRHVAVCVRDFGPGFPKKAMWFQPFHKTAQEAANSAPGVGLGLSLCKRLAKGMKGTLEIDSSPHGACVKLLLLRQGS